MGTSPEAAEMRRIRLDPAPPVIYYVSIRSRTGIWPGAEKEMPLTRRKHEDYAMTARIMKAVAQPIRLAIVDSLREGERSVGDIAQAVGAERSNVSRHLAVLTGAGILSSRKEGLQVFYKLHTPCILSVFGCVREVIKADVEAGQRALCCST